jgi:hypothetical protein
MAFGAKLPSAARGFPYGFTFGPVAGWAAWSTDVDAGSEGTALSILKGLGSAGAPGAAGAEGFCLAISAKAFKMLDVSGVADAPAAAACDRPARGFAPGAGDPSGVVESTSIQLMADD